MDYIVTVNLFHVLWMLVLAVVLYVYIKDNSDDRLTQMRHNVEVKKEWFRMLAEQNKQKAKRNKRA
jgi:hypothetical protein